MVHPGDSYPDRISRPSTLHAAATLVEPEYTLGNGRIRMPEFGLQLSARRLGLSCRSNAPFAACATSTSAIAGPRVPNEVAVALGCADRPAFPPWFQTPLPILSGFCFGPRENQVPVKIVSSRQYYLRPNANSSSENPDPARIQLQNRPVLLRRQIRRPTARKTYPGRLSGVTSWEAMTDSHEMESVPLTKNDCIERLGKKLLKSICMR